MQSIAKPSPKLPISRPPAGLAPITLLRGVAFREARERQCSHFDGHLRLSKFKYAFARPPWEGKNYDLGPTIF
jgi:hypothetical protein